MIPLLALANLHAVDLGIILVILVVILGFALYTRRYTKSVADFLSANRCAGRYLLTIAAGMAGIACVTTSAAFILHGTAIGALSPALVDPATAEV
jgi:Na+/proline symporter